MDFNHLQSLLSSIETRPDKIKVLTDYIILNSSSIESEVGNALQKAFNVSSLDKKLAIFYTISEILLISSQKREVYFFKVFGNKIKPLLEVLSADVKDIRVMKDICRTLDKWQTEEMFAENFMEKLKAAVKNFYARIREQSNEEQRAIGFRKYKKTLLMELNDLKNYRTSYDLYQNYCEYIEIEQKLTNVNLEFNKIDFDRSSENIQIHRRRCEQLLKIYNDLREKLENSIVKIHRSFNEMREWAIEEMETIKKQSGGQLELKKNNSNKA